MKKTVFLILVLFIVFMFGCEQPGGNSVWLCTSWTSRQVFSAETGSHIFINNVDNIEWTYINPNNYKKEFSINSYFEEINGYSYDFDTAIEKREIIRNSEQFTDHSFIEYYNADGDIVNKSESTLNLIEFYNEEVSGVIERLDDVDGIAVYKNYPYGKDVAMYTLFYVDGEKIVKLEDYVEDVFKCVSEYEPFADDFMKMLNLKNSYTYNENREICGSITYTYQGKSDNAIYIKEVKQSYVLGEITTIYKYERFTY